MLEPVQGVIPGDGGNATSAQLSWPYGVALDSSSNLYIADTQNNRIRKVSTSGIITTVAGTATWGYSGDGGNATSAELKNPYGVALDSSGNLYIADTNNHRIRKVVLSSEIGVTIPYATGGEVKIQPPTGEMRIYVLPFTFTADITLTISALTTLPVSNQPDVKVINVGCEITTSRPSEQPQKDITITMNYRDIDIFGYDENKLVIGYYDTAGNVWRPISSTPNLFENKVVGYTRHLSKFAILEVSPAPGLNDAFCYPSPARLSQGDTIKFAQFTPNAEVKILSPAGHILKTLKADATGGLPPWDGETDSSGKIASGVYVVHASDDKGNVKIFKIMIIK